MVNTKELMTAFLATSIVERSPWAWKLYYSGEAAEVLLKKSISALEIVMKRVGKSDERIRAKRKLEFEGDEKKKSGGGHGASSLKQKMLIGLDLGLRGRILCILRVRVKNRWY